FARIRRPARHRTTRVTLAVARPSGPGGPAPVTSICREAGPFGEGLRSRLRSRTWLGRLSGQSVQANRGHERVAGITSPVQVQANELLAQLFAYPGGEWPCAPVRLRVAGRALSGQRPRRHARTLRVESH